MAIRDLSLAVPSTSASGGNGEGPMEPSDPQGLLGPCPIFFSYSHFDLKWVIRALKHLGVLTRLGHIDVFHDQSNIKLGDPWPIRVKDAIEDSAIAICFLSPEYLDSEFCVEHEVPHMQMQMEAGNLRIIPIFLRDCLWDVHPLWSNLEVFTDEDKGPLVKGNGSHHRVEKNFVRLARKIHRLVTESDPEPPEPAAPSAGMGERVLRNPAGKGSWWSRPSRPRGPRGETGFTLAIDFGTCVSYGVLNLDLSGSVETLPEENNGFDCDLKRLEEQGVPDEVQWVQRLEGEFASVQEAAELQVALDKRLFQPSPFAALSISALLDDGVVVVGGQYEASDEWWKLMWEQGGRERRDLLSVDDWPDFREEFITSGIEVKVYDRIHRLPLAPVSAEATALWYDRLSRVHHGTYIYTHQFAPEPVPCPSLVLFNQGHGDNWLGIRELYYERLALELRDILVELIELLDHDMIPGRTILANPEADRLLKLRLLGTDNCATDDAENDTAGTLQPFPLQQKIPILTFVVDNTLLTPAPTTPTLYCDGLEVPSALLSVPPMMQTFSRGLPGEAWTC